MTHPYYLPSGRVPRSGIFIVAGIGSAAVPLALIYAWLISDLVIVLRPFVLWGVSAGLGALARAAAACGKVRDPRWMGRAGLGIGLLAWYIQWAAWIVKGGLDELPPDDEYLAYSAIDSIARLCADPATMFYWARNIVLSKTSIFVQCGLLIAWLIEFCACVLPPMFAGRRRANAPFCENGNQWAKEMLVQADFEWIADPQSVRRELETDPTRFTSKLVRCTADPVGHHSRLTLYRCPGPESFITIHNYEPMASEAAPVPPEMKNMMDASSDNVACFGEVEERIVALLRVPLLDPEAFLREWTDTVHVPDATQTQLKGKNENRPIPPFC